MLNIWLSIKKGIVQAFFTAIPVFLVALTQNLEANEAALPTAVVSIISGVLKFLQDVIKHRNG